MTVLGSTGLAAHVLYSACMHFLPAANKGLDNTHERVTDFLPVDQFVKLLFDILACVFLGGELIVSSELSCGNNLISVIALEDAHCF